MNKLFVLVFISLSNGIAAQDYTISYKYSTQVEFNAKGKIVNSYDRQSTLFVKGDSLSVFKFWHKRKENVKEPIDMLALEMHHGTVNPINKEYLLEVSASLGYNCFIKHFEKIIWNISEDSIKILGYTCFKATSLDSNIVAWYAPSISPSVGPTNYCGLAGTILKVTDFRYSLQVVATKIITSAPLIIIPQQMKTYSLAEFQKIRKEKEAAKGNGENKL